MINKEKIKQDLEEGKLTVDELIEQYVQTVEDYKLAKEALSDGMYAVVMYYTLNRRGKTFEELKEIINKEKQQEQEIIKEFKK